MENEKGKRKTCWTFESEDLILILILKESDNLQSTVTVSLMQLGLMLWRRRGKTKKKRWQIGWKPQGQNSLLSLNLRKKYCL